MGVIGKTLRFTLGLTLGVGIGAVAVMLLAPQSGKVTKQQLQERIDEIVSAGKALNDVLIFERPVGNFSYLRLELPLSAVGGEGQVRLQVPKAMVKFP